MCWPTSRGRYPPTEWARLAITVYATHGADRIVAEVNNGGDMVGATLRMIDPNVAFTAVRASRGKVVRAEPVAALYQQGRVHHIGTFPQLEDQMTNFTSDIDRAAAGYSPDRVDALVWAFSELLVEPMKSAGIYELYRRNAEAAEQRDKPQPTKTVYARGSMGMGCRAEEIGLNRSADFAAACLSQQRAVGARQQSSPWPGDRGFESISLLRRVGCEFGSRCLPCVARPAPRALGPAHQCDICRDRPNIHPNPLW
jgi:Terminase RNaseH-like domain